MAQPKRVLIPMSSHEDMGSSGIKTGSWFEEVASNRVASLAEVARGAVRQRGSSVAGSVRRFQNVPTWRYSYES